MVERPISYYVIRRPSPTPTVPVALGVRSVCWGIYRAGTYEDQFVRPWGKLMWGVRGQGLVRIERKVYKFPAGSVVVLFPGMKHEAWAQDENWEIRWLTFDGPLCEEIIRACGFPQAGVYSAGPVPVDLFEQLRQVIGDPTPQSERRADALGYSLLVSTNFVTPKLTLVIEEAKSLIQQNWPDSNFGIEIMARKIGIHRSRLSRLFHSEVGVSPMQYLGDLRLHHSLNLLKTTNMTVKQIARSCGYNDASHFCRVFHKREGLTPGQYRRK